MLPVGAELVILLWTVKFDACGFTFRKGKLIVLASGSHCARLYETRSSTIEIILPKNARCSIVSILGQNLLVLPRALKGICLNNDLLFNLSRLSDFTASIRVACIEFFEGLGAYASPFGNAKQH
jgi:hypothetical protein